ncbi:uncharacterized protein LOC133190112 [Saccostrea echinata]|uniref:uncharacterized protein LOC133190112 n=1 Tax=Saccostrea echinata TaxID=191078 RepID=UPI002A81D2AC|nr:uncharacterized protein LOC133190112 [Saccostrea echinata]
MSLIRRRALYKRKSDFSRSYSDEGSFHGETIYSQTLEISNDENDDDYDERVNEYVENVVNDTKQVFYTGPVFFKGSIICEKSRGEYTVHFYLYTKSIWKEDIKTSVKKHYLEDLVGQSPALSLRSERILQPWRCVFQGSVNANISDGCSAYGNKKTQIEDTEKEMITKFLEGNSLTRWTFMDILKEMYMFEVSHVTFLSRWVHFIATPINMILSMMFLSQFYLIGGRYGSIINLNASHILVFFLVAGYMRLGTIRKCELWGISVSIVILCLSLTGRSLYIRVCGYESCSEGIYILPLVFGFFTSLLQITSDYLYSDFSTGDITFEILKEILYGFTFDTSLSIHDQLRSIVWFFAWTVPSTFMSWVQQLGIQVGFVLTNIGYRPPEAEIYVKYLKRCEQNNLDIYHRLPKSSIDVSRMSMSSPCVLALKECGLMRKEKLTTKETLSLCVTIRLCSIYFQKK